MSKDQSNLIAGATVAAPATYALSVATDSVSILPHRFL